MYKYLINETEVEFEVFLLSMMACKRVINRQDISEFMNFMHTHLSTYRYVFKTNKELNFRIVKVA